MRILFSLFIVLACAQPLFSQIKCKVPKTVKEHTIGVIDIHHEGYKGVAIEIQRVKGNFFSIDFLDVVQLQNGSDGHRNYGFTGKPGDYLVTVSFVMDDYSQPKERFKVKIIGDENDDDDNPPDDDDDPPGPDDDDTDDGAFDGLVKRLKPLTKKMKAADRKRYRDALESVVADMEPPAKIRTVSAAKQYLKSKMEPTDRETQAVNGFINTESKQWVGLGLEQTIEYYRTLAKAF